MVQSVELPDTPPGVGTVTANDAAVFLNVHDGRGAGDVRAGPTGSIGG